MRTLRPLFVLLLGALVGLTPGNTNAGAADEADAVIKLLDYVEWPAGAASDKDGALLISVIGDAATVSQLKDLAAKRTAEGKKTTVKAISLDDTLTNTQVLYFTTQDKSELAKILKKVDSAPVLTVTNCPGFPRFGVMVGLFTEEGKVKFEINTMVVKAGGLKISSQLLKLARII